MATIGMDMLYYSKITEDSTGDEAYGPPIRLARAIKADLTIELAEATLYADDGAVYAIKDFKTGSLTLGVDDIGVTAAQDLTGSMVDDNGVLVSASESDGGPVAIGFRALKPNGKYRYFWLYRVKFGLPATNLQTKGDSITFQTPSIEGVVLRRNKKDDKGRHPWKVEATEGDDGVNASVISGWYTTVYEPVFGTEPAKSHAIPSDPVTDSGGAAETAPEDYPAPVISAFMTMSRMGLKVTVDYMFDLESTNFYIRLADVYKRYIAYCTENGIHFTRLPYKDFLAELKKCDFYVGSEKKNWPDGNVRSVWVLDFKKLLEHCDVTGFLALSEETAGSAEEDV